MRAGSRSAGPTARGGRKTGRRGLGLLLALGLMAAPAAAQQRPAQDATAPPVTRDALFKLPSGAGLQAAQPSAGGATRSEWRERFATARGDLAEARERLEKAQTQLGELASGSGSWQVAAPVGGAGAAGENGPLSYALRQEIRRGREDIARAEQALDELRIQANLAGVPPEWTAEEPPVSAAEPEPEPVAR